MKKLKSLAILALSFLILSSTSVYATGKRPHNSRRGARAAARAQRKAAKAKQELMEPATLKAPKTPSIPGTPNSLEAALRKSLDNRASSSLVHRFDMQLNLAPSSLNPHKIKNSPFKSDITAFGPVQAKIEYSLRGKDSYTAAQERALLTKVFTTGKLSVKPSEKPALKTNPDEEQQSWWATKNILITSVLARENPAELRQLENIPDLADKVTAQDVLYLTLLKKWTALDLLIQKGLPLNQVFEQPIKEVKGLHQIKPSRLIKYMVHTNDTDGLIFLLTNGVDFNRVFTEGEIERLKTNDASLLMTLEGYGLKTGALPAQEQETLVRNNIIMGCVKSLLRAKPEVKAETAFEAAQKILAENPQLDIATFKTNLEKKVELIQIHDALDNPQEVERLLTHSKNAVALARSILGHTLFTPTNTSAQTAHLIAQTFERENAIDDLNDMLFKLMAYNSFFYSLACDLIDVYHVDANVAFKLWFVKAPRPAFLQLFLERGADANQLVQYEGHTVHPLIYTTKEKLADATDLLASFEADVNVQDEKGNTPAHYATKNMDILSLNILAKYEADFDIPNHEGVTVRHLLKEIVKNKRLKLDFRGAKEISQLLER